MDGMNVEVEVVDVGIIFHLEYSWIVGTWILYHKCKTSRLLLCMEKAINAISICRVHFYR